MSNIIDNLKMTSDEVNDMYSRLLEFFKDPKIMTLSIILIIIFVAASIYTYFRFIQPLLKRDYVDNSEFLEKKDERIVILWFYTEWCPYCKSTYDQWLGFKSDVENGSINKPIEFREVDCDRDEIIANKYNIVEYPSIRIVYKDEVFIYDAKPDRIELMEFLKGSLPEEVNWEDVKDNIVTGAKTLAIGSKL